MKMEAKLQQFKEILGEVDDLQKAAAVLDWDLQTYMPPAGSDARAMQLATLQKLAHIRFVSEEVGQLLEDLRSLTAEMEFDSETASLIRVTLREYEKARKIPDDLVADDIGRPQSGMPRKGDLGGGREDAHLVTAVAFDFRQNEGGLGEVHLLCDLLHLVAREFCRVSEDRELIACVSLFREDIHNIER